METTTSKLLKLVITGAPRLDPIHVYLEDLRPQAGSLLVRCFDRAWYAYWGAMGTQKDGSPTMVRQFVLSCDTRYLAANLVRGNRGRITSEAQQRHEEEYVERIAGAIQQALRDTQPRMTKARAARLERLEHANRLIKVISDHGRRFFWCESKKRLARLELTDNGKLYWIDDYSGKAVYTGKIGGYDHKWRGFTHGGTLKSLAQQMCSYVNTGERIRLGYIAQDCWGYSKEDAITTRDKAFRIPIIYL